MTPDAILSGLNPQQAAAVTTTHAGPVLVLAGAGCGKTHVLTRRIAFIAATRCAQERTLALTFTRKAADEMASRVASVPGIDAGQPQPLVTTFHGFGYRIMRESVDGQRNAERIGYHANPVLVDEAHRLKLLADCSSREERTALGHDLLSLDALIERRAVNPQRFQAMASDRVRLIDSIAKRLAERKLAQSLWDFSDMLHGALTLLERFPDLARHYAGRYDAILVDEFQDTNPVQIELLRRLLRPETLLFAVGDDDQAIYGFRGADTGPILDFAGRFPGAALLKLETNYRSTPAILRAANRVFREKPAAYRKVLRSGRYSDGPTRRYARPLKRRSRTEEDLVRWMRSTAQRLCRAHNVPVERMAALFRLNESRERAESLYLAGIAPDEPRPHFLTIHGSKGLEFPVVFLCDLEESVLPNYRRSSRRKRSASAALRRLFVPAVETPRDCDLEEERRLFYVGVTRAERFLYLVSVCRKRVHGVTREMDRSRFLSLL